MKAALLTRHGGNDVLSVGSLPDPVAGPGEVLVRISAAALNRLDIFVRNGIPGVPVDFPHVPGADGCGRVEALGSGVTGLVVGERVVLQPGLSCGGCEFCRDGERSLCVDYEILGEHRAGTLAERIAVPAANVWKAPASLTDEEAAAFPLAAMTAWRMLVTRAALRPGESVLIHGIGGGVSAPTLVFKVEPEYSEEARKAKFQGTVVLYVVVDEKGNPRDLKVVRALGLGLDQKAIEAVQKWRFKPGLKDGKPVPVAAQIEVNFRLL